VDGTAKRLPIPNVACVKFGENTSTIVAGLMDYRVAVFDFTPHGRKRKVKQTRDDDE
jgi:hypothetical protein